VNQLFLNRRFYLYSNDPIKVYQKLETVLKFVTTFRVMGWWSPRGSQLTKLPLTLILAEKTQGLGHQNLHGCSFRDLFLVDFCAIQRFDLLICTNFCPNQKANLKKSGQSCELMNTYHIYISPWYSLGSSPLNPRKLPPSRPCLALHRAALDTSTELGNHRWSARALRLKRQTGCVILW
jgi:hypothetical protein